MNTMPVVGSLITVPNSLDTEASLGLVVDQIAGKEWVILDPVLKSLPDPNWKTDFVLVRILGERLTEDMSSHKSSIPENEPNKLEMVRWEFDQVNLSRLVAGPDVVSVENFYAQARMCIHLGARDITFMRDVSLLIEYFHGVTRTEDSMSYYDRLFLSMLSEVLPKN